MHVIILGGFLGSGKTTSLLSLARYLVANSTTDSPNKVAILENEIGEVGIDDKVLLSSGFSVSNLFAGCACCTVSGEFSEATRKIQKELNPEWLIIETTGIAYPESMRDTLIGNLGITARILVIVDAKRWSRLLAAMGSLIEAQIVGSTAVLINKCDLADEYTLSAIEADILRIEPAAKLLRITAKNGIADSIWQQATT